MPNENNKSVFKSNLAHDGAMRVSTWNKLIDRARQLFKFGYHLESQGKSSQAHSLYQKAISDIEAQLERPQAAPVLKVAEIAMKHSRELYSLGNIEQAIGGFRRAVELLAQECEGGVDFGLIEQLASAHQWLALSLRRNGDLDLAAKSYREAIVLWRSLLAFAPRRAPRGVYHHRLSTCEAGLFRTELGIARLENTARH